MKRQLTLGLWLLMTTAYVHAQTDVYLCVDEHGRKEYKNTGATKGCKKIDLPTLSMVPAPKRTSASVSSSRSPSDFPRVDSDTQKSRDADRRQILMDEMRNEEQKLTDLKKEYNNGEPERRGDERNYAKYQERVAALKEDINRSEKNIEALKREIANLR